MINNIRKISENIFELHRYTKRVIAILTDASICILCTWLAFCLRLEQFVVLKDFNYFVALISVSIALPVFWLFGLYKIIFRYTSLSIMSKIFFSTSLYCVLFFIIIGVYGISSYSTSFSNVPRSIGIIQPMLLFFLIASSRLVIKYLYDTLDNSRSSIKKNVLIYGAGNAGRQLNISLENSLEFIVKGFLDDSKKLYKQVLLGQNVYSPSDLKKLIKTKKIEIVFLAMPSINRKKRNQIIKRLNKHKLIVKTLPSISEILDGRITTSDIKDYNINDLLNRDEVKPDIDLLNRKINSETVLVTGAGGSIGSELCRQIIRLNPKKLLILELNEFALYKIYEELNSLKKNLKIIPLIANCQDQKKLESIFESFMVDIVYHTAAYKHVPLVEENICEGIKNNVFSTLAVAKASVNKKIKNLVLISSDKAVRPTNIMGASKRLSELCMQGIYDYTKNISINFSIVRFGNVLESSGSVIPKFKRQIKEGGPITLTHSEVTRYFMTKTEAAQLVLQAGAMGDKCEVFVLDMGESVKIRDLVYKMVNLSGFTIKDSKTPNGDIEIKIIGLRPGEKLFEELLIGNSPRKTIHSKIFKTNEPFISFNELEIDLNKLRDLVDNHKTVEAKNLLDKLVKINKSNSKIVDHIYLEQLFSKKKAIGNPIDQTTNVFKIQDK